MTMDSSSPSPRVQSQLIQGLGHLDAIALVVGTIIGTGIFLKAAVMAQLAESIIGVILAWLVAAILSLLGALCYAELGSRMPESGGEYVFLKNGWHPSISFLYGWTRFWIASPSAISAYAVGASTFASGFLNVDLFGGRAFIAIFLVVIFTIINCLKVSFGGRIQIALTILKIGLITSIAAGVFLLSPVGNWNHLFTDFQKSWAHTSMSGFGGAVLAALWAFDGWNNMPMAASEIRNGQKNIPKALFIGLGIVTTMYIVANLAWFYGVNFDEIILSNSTKFPDALPVASKAVLPFMGQTGLAVVSIAFVMSAIGAMNGSILTSARVPWAMARDGLFPRWMAAISPSTHVPIPVILIQGFTASAFAATGTFDQLTDYVVFSSWIWYALAAGTLFRLRKSNDDFQGYKIRWFPLIPILFIGSSIWLLIQAILENPQACAIGAGIIGAGIPAYLKVTSFQKNSKTGQSN